MTEQQYNNLIQRVEAQDNQHILDMQMCQNNFDRLLELSSQVIALMHAPLDRLGQMTQAMEADYDGTSSLTQEQRDKAFLQHFQASREVTRAHYNSMKLIVSWKFQ